jgi:hypothetical protein
MHQLCIRGRAATGTAALTVTPAQAALAQDGAAPAYETGRSAVERRRI